MTKSTPVTTDPVHLTRDLLVCPSVTPDEGGALIFLDDVLSRAGFDVHRVVFSDDGTPDVENLYARIGTSGPHLTFAGHTDVVPPGDTARWSRDPFAGDIVDGILFGRGAVDMKGGIAAFLSAALRFLERRGEDFGGSISFLITGDEEGPAVNGTRKLLEWCAARGEAFDAAVVGEPTNPNALGDTIKIGRRGSLNGTLTIIGKQGHAAYPHLADNPIPGLVRLLDALLTEPLDHGTEHFQPTNLEVTSVDVGNTASNVIPAQATARFNIRFNDTWTANSLIDWLKARLDTAAGNAVVYQLDIDPTISEVFLTQAEDLIETLSDAVEAVIGARPELSTGGGTSDARFIKDYCPVIEFGLVGQTMHQVDERVPVTDLERLAAIYEQFLDGYFRNRDTR